MSAVAVGGPAPARSLPVLEAVAWSCHAKTTIRGDVDGVKITFAECSGNGLHSISNAAHAAAIVDRCNAHDQLVAALEQALGFIGQVPHHVFKDPKAVVDFYDRNFKYAPKPAAIAKGRP